MLDHVTVGKIQPTKEACEQLIAEVRKVLGPEPTGCRLTIRKVADSFEVALNFDDTLETYAHECERRWP